MNSGDTFFVVLEGLNQEDELNGLDLFKSTASRIEKIYEIAKKLEENNWRIEVDEEEYWVFAFPPEDIEEEDEINEILEGLGVNLENIGVVDYNSDEEEDDDEDYDDYIDRYDEEEEGDEEIFTVCGNCDCEEDEDEPLPPIMVPEMAEELVGKTITSVDIEEDYKVIFHLSDGRKLVYDENEFGFTLET